MRVGDGPATHNPMDSAISAREKASSFGAISRRNREPIALITVRDGFSGESAAKKERPWRSDCA